MYYGQHGEDARIEYWINKIGLKNKRCIDIGCSDGVKGSNTKYFEDIGWDCICIDPILEHVELARKVRKTVYPVAVYNLVGVVEFTKFKIGKFNIMSSISSICPDQRLIDQMSDIIQNIETIYVPCMPLNFLIPKDWNNSTIDFISIDTEGTELDILKNIVPEIDVSLFVVENNFDSQEIVNFMKDFGFSRVERLVVNDFYIKV